MKLSLITSGLLDPKRLESWVPAKRQAIRKAVEAGMASTGREIAGQVRARMQSAFKVKKSGFVKSMRHKVYPGTPSRFPALLIGSRIPWLGIHMHGGSIGARMLIALLPEHQRIGRKAFKRVIDSLMRAGNAYFIEHDGKVILMAENLKDNQRDLRRFKRAERARTGAKSIKRGEEVPIAVLVRSVNLRARFDLPALVGAQLPRLSAAILQHLTEKGL